MNEIEKLQTRLAHWISHNQSHCEEFRQGAELARSLHLTDAAPALDRAGELLQQASECLESALQALKES